MAFVNQLFPNPKLVHGLVRQIEAPTFIVSNGSVEYRLQKQSNYRTTWTWAAHGMKSTDMQDISLFISDVAFFGLNSFKFKDPYFNTWNETQLTYTGTGTKYYLTMRGNQDTHPIFHLGGDIVVKRNGTPTTYTRVIENGVPMIEVPATGTITISGTFYFAARLDQSQFTLSMVGLGAGNSALVDAYEEIRLVEVAEY